MRKFGVTLCLVLVGILAGCGGSGSSGGSTNVGLPPSSNAQPTLSVLGMSGAAPTYTLNVQQGNALAGTVTLHGSDSDTNDNLTLSLSFNAGASTGYSSIPAQLLISPAPSGTPATATTSAASPALATITIAPNGALSAVGSIVFNANLADDKGGATSATLTINVSAGPVNNPPAIGRPSGPVTVSGNHPNYTATVQAGASLAFSATATDPDSNTVTLSANRTGGTLTASAAGFSTTFPASVNGVAPRTLTLAGTAATAGSVEITFTVNDGQGGTDTAVLLITIQQPSGGGSSVPTNGTGGATGTVSGAYQSRNYRLFVPTSYTQSTPTALVIALHGAGDTYTNFYSVLQAYGWTSAATSNNFILMAPQHMNASRPSFLHLTGTGGLDATATANEIQGVINAAYHGVGASYNIETTKIYFIGFSEGGVVTDITAYWHSDKIKAVAPYAGAATGKTFPVTRNIPVYPICGTADSGYSGSVGTYNEWTNAGHATNSAWVSGVGHSFSQLCTTGPSPSSVYQWLATAQSNPVQSGYQGGGGGPGTGGSNPSGGSGGSYPGNQQRTVSTSYGNQTYYLYIPSSYNPSSPMPVLFGFHGAGGTGTAPAAAQQVRNDWSSVASSGNFIVVAQAATGSGGGWVPSTDTDILNSIITDVFGAYNIEQKRIYAWGFSAGGHYAHALCLNNSGYFAAYGISAGALQSLAGTGAPAAATRKIPCSLYVGNTDPLQPYVNSDRQAFINAGWTLNTNLWYTEFSGGHTYSTSHLSAIWGHIGSHILP